MATPKPGGAGIGAGAGGRRRLAERRALGSLAKDGSERQARGRAGDQRGFLDELTTGDVVIVHGVVIALLFWVVGLTAADSVSFASRSQFDLKEKVRDPNH